MSSKAYATLTITDVGDGVGVNTITYTYAVTTTQTEPSASSITSTTMPTLSSTNKFLWRKEVITYTDSTKTPKTTVSLIAVYGDTGGKGDNGRGISTITPLYYCSDVATIPSKPTKSTTIANNEKSYNVWNKAVPKWTETYRYYFTCDEILYDDNTTKEWTDPVLNNAISDAYNVQIGGRNYLRNSGDLVKWHHVTSYIPDINFTNGEVHISHGASQSWNYVINMYPKIKLSEVLGKELIFSCLARSDCASTTGYITAGFSTSNSEARDNNRLRYKATNICNATDFTREYKKITFSVKLDESYLSSYSSDANNVLGQYFFFQLYNYSLSDIWVKDLKLENGNKDTDWSIAPEDTTSYITDNEKWKADVEFKISEEGIKSVVSASLNVGGTNLIRNSETLEFADYYFDGSVVATQSANQTTVRGVAGAYQTNNSVKIM